MSISMTWQPFINIPTITKEKIYLWKVDLDQKPKLVKRLSQELSEEECKRADRFYFPYLRSRFIAARSALRILAGRLMGESASDIKFAYTQHGKPFFENSEIQFNVSHTNNVALIAFSLDRRVGVDVEQLRPMKNFQAIARRFFAADEVADILQIPSDQQQRAFFNCWTRKEAYIKALGEGLSHPLNQFQVSLKPDQPAQLLKVYNNPGETDLWKLIAVDPSVDYIGALIAEGQDWNLSAWDFAFPDTEA